MKILVVSCSPRAVSCSSALAEEFIQGARSSGNEVFHYSLAGKSLHGCNACKYCYTHGGACIQQDDIAPIIDQMRTCEMLVLATPMCVKSRRFLELQRRFSRETRVIPVPCPGLMEFVERGELDSPALRAYLDERLAPWRGQRIDAAVLGCTHYPFLRAAITAALPPETELIDGNAGITAQLCRRLDEHGLRNPGPHPGEVRFFNSLGTEEILRLSRQLLALPE